MKNYNVVVFDLDGTLVDSVPDIALALNHAFQGLGFPPLLEEQVRTWVGNGSLKLVERALEFSQTLSADRLQLAHAAFLESYEDFLCHSSVLYPGVRDALTQLQSRQVQLVVLTNKPYRFVPKLLQQLGIDDVFTLVLGGDSLEHKKPHPQPLLHVLTTLGVNGDQCLMVGDSQADILCAKQAGVDSVALWQGYHQGVDLPQLDPTYLFDDMAQFNQAISQSE